MDTWDYVLVIILLGIGFAICCMAYNLADCGTLSHCSYLKDKIVSSYCQNYEYVSDSIYKCDGKLLSCTDESCSVFKPASTIKEKRVQIIEEES